MSEDRNTVKKVESQDDYPFADTREALIYYHNNNPARARYKNLLEEVRGSRPAFEQFSGLHPADLWAGIIGAIEDAIVCFPLEHRRIWALTYLIERARQLHPIEVASKTGLSRSTVYRRQREVNDEIARRLRFRQLIPPEADKY